MFNKKTQLEGAWEEPGIFGLRLEIEGSRLTVLWRNSPVLVTPFKLEKTDGETVVKLSKTGLRYQGSYSDYAEVRGLVYKDERLVLTEFFPITGESVTRLSKTENSRYGCYDIADEKLREIQGRWTSGEEYFDFTVKGSTLTMGAEKYAIHMIKSRTDDEYYVVDADPSVLEWRGFSRFEYRGDTIETRMLVCDAPSIPFVFRRAK